MQQGWYDDPWIPGGKRWWDGTAWTANAAPGAAQAAEPAKGGRRVWPWLLGGALVLLLLLLVVGGLVVFAIGSNDDDSQRSGSRASAPSAPAPPSTTPKYEPPGSNKKPVVDLGQGVVLRDQDQHRVQVQILQIVDPVPKGGYFQAAKKGSRYVGVRMKLTGAGPGTYDDDPFNGTRVITGQKRYKAEVADLDRCPQVTGTVKLSQGESATGCVIFVVPKAQKATKVTFTPSSGYAPDTGTWRVR